MAYVNLGKARGTGGYQQTLANGINFFDTADMYSNGVSEEVVGPRHSERR